jgi:hypothetical protein
MLNKFSAETGFHATELIRLAENAECDLIDYARAALSSPLALL